MPKFCSLLDATAAMRRVCAWPDCQKPLSKYRRRWCSDTCGLRYFNEHSWAGVVPAVFKRDGHKCVRCGSSENLEAHHKVARNSGGYQSGCHNHQVRIETLCRACHGKESAQQRVWRPSPRVVPGTQLPMPAKLLKV